MNTDIVEQFRSVSLSSSTVSYRYGDSYGQCLEITTITTPTKQYYINTTGGVSETLPGTCPTPSSTVTIRCITGEVSLTVRQTNYMSAAVSLEYATPYGNSTNASVLPGASATAAFSVRQPTMQAGVATVKITNSTNPSESTTRFHPYPAASC